MVCSLQSAFLDWNLWYYASFVSQKRENNKPQAVFKDNEGVNVIQFIINLKYSFNKNKNVLFKLTIPKLSFLLSLSSRNIWFRCSIISVLSYVYAEMSLFVWNMNETNSWIRYTRWKLIYSVLCWMLLTISTTSTSAGILSWYKNVLRSFFIWIEL